MSCALFNTHFVRDGNNNYAIVQSNDKVSFASYVVSERHSSSSIGTRTFSGRVEKPRALYQWNTNLIENIIAAEPVPVAAPASSTEEVVAAPHPPSNVYNNALSFTFPVMKGCIYFIQITFGLGNETDLVEQRSIHMNVDPNKRRLVTSANKRATPASLIKTDGSAAPSTAPTPRSGDSAPDSDVKTLSTAPNSNKKPRRATPASGKSAKGLASSTPSNTDPALVM
jgi:hypothetical protein